MERLYNTFDSVEELQDYIRKETKQALKEFFTQNFLDACSTDHFMTDPAYVQDQQLMMEQQFDNDVEAVYEHADMADYNPVIGLAFPIHKNILMNMVFDKGAIQKVVAEGPKFTISMETRILVDTEGNEIDMYLEQNKMTPAIDKSNPVHDIDLTLPEMGETDVLAQCGGTKLDSLSIKTYISAIMIEKCYIAEGDIKPDENNVIRPNGPIATADDVGEKTDVWFPVDIRFAPGYNQYEKRCYNQ